MLPNALEVVHAFHRSNVVLLSCGACLQKLAEFIGSLLASALTNQEQDITFGSCAERCVQARKVLHLMSADRDGFGWLLKGVEQHVIKVQHPLDTAIGDRVLDNSQMLPDSMAGIGAIEREPTSLHTHTKLAHHPVVKMEAKGPACPSRKAVGSAIITLCQRGQNIQSPYLSQSGISTRHFRATNEAAALLLAVAAAPADNCRRGKLVKVRVKREKEKEKNADEGTYTSSIESPGGPAMLKIFKAATSSELETLRWHCAGTLRTYINHKRLDGDWTQCPNVGCQNFAKWDSENNLRCKFCQLKNRQRRKDDKPALHWRWVRCAAENCKAMYVFNRGSRLKRSADRCGLLKRNVVNSSSC